MGSLEKVTTAEALAKWADDIRKRPRLEEAVAYVLEPKIDGSAVSLVYESGALRARSDARGRARGEDVTGNLRTLSSVPLRLRSEEAAGHSPRCAARSTSRSPGSTASTTRRSRWAQACAECTKCGRGFVATAQPRRDRGAAVVDLRVRGRRPRRHRPRHAVGDAPGCTASGSARTPTQSDWSRSKRWPRPARRGSPGEARLGYEIDGIVIKVDSFAQQEALGSCTDDRGSPARTSGRRPRRPRGCRNPRPRGSHRRAQPAGRASSRSRWEASRSPARRCTTRTTFAARTSASATWSSCNAGDVIPQVVGPAGEHEPGTKPWRMPKRCPLCRAEIVKPEGEVMHRCPNRACPSRGLETLYHWVGPAMDIEGVGGNTVKKLWDEGLVRSLPDLYRDDGTAGGARGTAPRSRRRGRSRRSTTQGATVPRACSSD